jgi:hypothetical protein
MSTLFTRLENEELLSALESFIQAYKDEMKRKNSPSIPLGSFSEKKLGILESLTKYLRENLGMTYSEIAKASGRDLRTIWRTYMNARRKKKNRIKVTGLKPVVPIYIFKDRRVGPLEALVYYQKENLGLSFRQISKALNRSYCSIWLSYRNAQKKIKQKDG